MASYCLVARRACKKAGQRCRGGVPAAKFPITHANVVFRKDERLLFKPYVIKKIAGVRVAILGLGRIHQAPVAREGRLEVATILPLSLVFDHRVCDGSYAVKFLNHFIELVSKPIRILR